MQQRANKWARILLLVVFCISLALTASCRKGPKDTDVPVNDYGIDNVFFMKENEKEYLFTISGNTFLISGLNGDQRGTFTYENGTLNLTFKEDNATTASATLEDGVLKLVYNGNTYRMVKREYFSVKYVDGSETISAENVLNAQTAKKPDDPKKEGHVFLGWYEDEAYQKPFAFDSVSITKDTTVYARFEKLIAGATEYTASLFSADAVYNSVRTVNGVLYNLPTPQKEGATFAGWWVSDYQNAEKLTYKYEGQVLTQDVTLFAVFKTAGAPLVSITPTGAIWAPMGASLSYRVTVKKGDQLVAENNVGTNSYTYDFATKEAGDYSITVEVNGKSSTVYYKNKALTRPSNLRVISSSVLVYDPVPNAQKYLVTVMCGNPSHSHIAVNNGNSTNFNFANCDMPEDGIKFAVTAMADGYLDSISEMFVYTQSLGTVSGITVNNQMITWYAVENATAYYVELSNDGQTYTKHYVTSGTSYSIANLGAGTVYVRVTPVSTGYYSTPSEAVTFNKTSLAAPTGVSVSGTTLTWNAVEGAASYIVNIDGTTYPAASNSLEMTEEMLATNKTSYRVSVQALGSTDEAASPYSETASVNYGAMGALVYKNGYLYWPPVIGAEGYKVTVGNRTYNVSGNASSMAVQFTSSGTNTLSVCYINENGDESSRVSISVNVYMIELDPRGGVAVSNIYKAIGDDIVLPVTTRDGYDFAGWYLMPDALTNNGKAFEQTVLDASTPVIAYAGWSAKKYTVTLDAGIGTAPATTIQATYGLYNKAPVATVDDGTKMFSGWFSEPNGAGIRYFNENGEALFRWNLTSDITLYAYYSETLSFLSISNGTAYSVSKGPYGIGNLTKITIPATYNGLPVTTIEASAFISCSTMREINIPNTIENIELGIQGINQAGSAFQGCTNLAAINIYDAGAAEPRYHSNDGVLYYNNEFNGKELKAYPYAKAGVFYIENGTTTIPANVIRNSKITEVYIPHTVTTINSQAFYSNSYLTKIVFLDVPEGDKAQPLSLASQAVYLSSKLTSVTLPARLSEFNVDSFQSCSALTSIDIVGRDGSYSSKGEDGRRVLCNAAGDTLIFCPKGMTGSFTIPTGVTTIGEEAFKSCTKLTEVIIPGFVTKIEKHAFESCSGIQELKFEEDGSALTICEGAFYSCSGLTSLTLPSGLVKMEVNAFGATTNLTTVTVNAAGIVDSEGTRYVEYATNAFGTTSATPTFYVTDVILGEKVPTLDVAGIFGQKIINVTVDPGNQNYASVDGILFNKDITSIVYYPITRIGEYVLPETVTTIGARVFQGKTGLTKITIGKNVTTVGEDAFYSCSKLEEIIFAPDGTAPLEVGKGAFRSCYALTSITLPERLKSIGENAFQSCSKITELVVPESVTSIGASAFASCSQLKTVTLPSTLSDIALSTAGKFDIFNSCGSLTEIKFSGESNSYTVIDGILYKKTDGVVTDLLFAPQQKTGTTVVVIPGTVTSIYPEAFYSNKVITEIIFLDLEEGKDLTVGDKAFGSCSKLSKVTLPKGMTAISPSMFYSCSSLEELVIPNTVTSIGNQAFYSCSKLSKLTFEEGGTEPLVVEDATSYSYSPFAYCTSLKNIVFPERFTKLGNYAFSGYSYESSVVHHTIETVVFPSTLKTIGERAFYLADKLKSVTFAPGTALEDNGNVPGIGMYAFNGTKALESIVLPGAGDAKYTISHYAFGSSGIRSLYISANVKSIGVQVFNSCQQLTDVTFAEGCYLEDLGDKVAVPPSTSATNIKGEQMFGNTKIKNITLPEGIKVIPKNMFYNCTLLETIVIPSSVTLIGEYAFQKCASLTEITFATYEKDGKQYSSVQTIYSYAFQDTGLTSFTFPTLEGDKTLVLNGSTSSPTNTNSHLFSGCKKLETVVLSKSVNKIDNVFTNCYSIKNVLLDDENENFATKPGSSVLFNKTFTAYRLIIGQLVGEHIIPEGITEISNNAFENQMLITKIVIPTSMQTIGDYAFQKCASLKEVVFVDSEASPSQMREYGTYMFAQCIALEKVTFPTKLTTIPNYTFQKCTALTSFDLWEGLETIGNYAFSETSLTSITIPSTVKTIGEYAFGTSSKPTAGVGTLKSLTFAKNANGETALTQIGIVAFKYQQIESVVIPKSVQSIGNNAFSYNPVMTSFTFEEGINLKKNTSTSNYNYGLGTSLFENNTALKSIVIPKSATKLENNMFKGCTDLESVIFEDDSALTSFGTYVFQGCALLKSIEIPANVTALGNYMFKESGIESITFAGAKLTTLGTYTFQNCTELKSIKIPDSVKVIGTSATAALIGSSVYTFDGCTSLKEVELGADTTLIGGYVFRNCTSLESIVIPKSTTQLGSYCFDGCSNLKTVTFDEKADLNAIGPYCFRNTGLESIVIPDKVTFFGSTAAESGATATSSAYQFAGCASLKSVTLGKNLKKLGGYVFQNCTSLESIEIPASVTQVGSHCFDGCSNLNTVDFKAGTAALTFGTYTFQNCTSLESIALPDRLTALPDYAFIGCSNLVTVTMNKIASIGNSAFRYCPMTSVTLPETLKTISINAFMDTDLVTVHIPKDVITIGDNAFGCCYDLEMITVDSQNKNFISIDGVLYKKNPSTVICIPCQKTGSITIPKDVLLGGFSLNGCRGITEVILEDGTETIPASAFIGTQIQSIRIPASVTSIGDNAFQNCKKLKSVIFEEGSQLTSIGRYAFAGSGIESIVIPAGITQLGSTEFIATYTFDGCESLTSVTFLGELTSINGYAFQNCKALKTFEIPETVRIIGSYAFSGSGIESITIPEGVLSFSMSTTGPSTLSTYTFKNCVDLKEVILPESMISLVANVFQGCTALQSINIPSAVTSFGAYLFDGCTSLKSVNFKEDSQLNSIGQYAFRGCESLESITIPEGIVTFYSTQTTASYTFQNCTSLKSVTFLGPIHTINGYAFAGCTSLETFEIPGTVTYLGSHAFENSGLKEIQIPSNVTTVSAYCFAGTKLKTLTIPGHLETSANLSTYVFSGCAELETVVMEEGCTYINNGLFKDCVNLKSIVLPSTLLQISSQAFENCASLKEIVIPAVLTNVYSKAFAGLTADQTIYIACRESESVNWIASWREGCEAVIVWEYDPKDNKN